MGGILSRLLCLLQYCRYSSRLIQSVALWFALSLGIAIASPIVQAHNQSPDQQVICVGNGGMKVVTFAADGTAVEVQTTHSLDCPLCAPSGATPPASQSPCALQASTHAQPIWLGTLPSRRFESLTPPARAPPLAF